jgi:hypothetical protein
MGTDLWGGIQNVLGIGSGDPGNPYRDALGGDNGIGARAGGLAGYAGQQYGLNNYALGNTENYLKGQMQGQNSVSAEQLRQGLQQQLAQQQSMAASANPNDSAMAARNAAMNMGQASQALAGQQATAGLQERNAAAQQLGQLQLGQLGTNAQTALGGFNAATGAYGAALSNPQKTVGGFVGGLLGGAAGGGAALLSDKRAKKGMKNADVDAKRLLDGLRPVSYKYKDARNGVGKQLGITAQDLAKGLPSAVVDSPRGKMIDTAKLSAGLAAGLASINKRVSQLERRQ